MKHYSLIAIIFILISTKFAFSQSGVIAKRPESYIGKTFRVDTIPEIYGNKKYNFFIWDIKESSMGDNQVFANGKGGKTQYQLLVNQEFKCIDAGNIKKHGDEYCYLKLNNDAIGTIFCWYENDGLLKDLPNLVNIEEEKKVKALLDSLNNVYLGKKIWLKYDEFAFFNSNDRKDVVKNAALRFKPVTVIAITKLRREMNIFRVQFKTPLSDKIGFIDFDERPFVNGESDPYQTFKAHHLHDWVYLTDPIITYRLTPTDLLAIKKGEISIGMRKDLVMLIIGKPDKINRTTSAYSIDEQWVYPNSYYYFINGKLTAVQN